jgi:hypothetical protein
VFAIPVKTIELMVWLDVIGTDVVIGPNWLASNPMVEM